MSKLNNWLNIMSRIEVERWLYNYIIIIIVMLDEFMDNTIITIIKMMKLIILI